MTLHDRIMTLPKRTPGQLDTVKSAARMAQEADELMAEMAKELEISCECKYGDCIICDVLQKYKTYKEQN